MFSFFLHCHFSTTTTTTTTKLPKLSSIPTRYRNFALREAQKALINYLYATRCLPFTYAEHIGNNTLRSLTHLIAKVKPFSAPTFPKSFERVLRYHPVNEFEVFFESIGIEFDLVSGLLPHDKVFFSEDGTLFNVACALSDFGFPWEKLGLLYMEKSSIFGRSVAELKSRLFGFKGFGFGNVEVIGMSLAFPFVLSEEGQVGVEIDVLFDELKMVFLDYGLDKSIEGDVDSWYEMCRKLRLFFDLNGWKGGLGELIGRKKGIFVEHKEEELAKKIEYFCRFDMKKEEVARLILLCPELLSLDLEKLVINVLKLLKHFGLSSKGVEDVHQNFSHALGTNKMVNLPNVMRALGLQKWFVDKLKDGHCCLLADYITSYPCEEQNKDYQDGLRMIHVSRVRVYNLSKLNFLHGLGFGENGLTMNVLNNLHGTSYDLQERFDCLLRSSIEFSKLCMMVRMTPRILNQNSEIMKRKVNFLHKEFGTTLDYVNAFPAMLYYHLDDRIIPRYKFHLWLTEKGLSCKTYSIRSMIANGEKKFVARVFKIHPAAPKHWFEQFCRSKLPM
ncbi:transcription termination factor MTEF18, mitochondrial-like [Abrus precatorius]|uniref:Transcription termination factor MTEF18, mitochondrial-like n=1 Tax=Abrus precatorius TaxID=3816 RepID=A0A8B8L7G9_ABRPR|nr:transcription termination factor MTEF18, mitochondrial-like [Abrus precatorius]